MNLSFGETIGLAICIGLVFGFISRVYVDYGFIEIELANGDKITKEHAKKYKLTCLNGLVVNKDGLNVLNGSGKPLGCE